MLAVGLGAPANFEPFVEGQIVPIVLGTQGGYMITPVVRADQARLGGDGRCTALELVAEVGEASPVRLSFELARVEVADGYAFSGTIPFLLSFDPIALQGQLCLVSAFWRDDAREASAFVTIMLAYDEP